MSTQRPPASPATSTAVGPRAVETKAPIQTATPRPPAAEGGRPAAATAPPADLSPESRRERHRRETFERLVRAAREIMFSRGFSDITVQDITEAADVGKGTFFNYFRSKEHIVTRVQEYNRRGIILALERVRAGEQTPQQALTTILTWILCPTGGDWLTYQSNTMRALALHPEVREFFSPELRTNHELYTQVMTLGQQQGTIRTDVTAEDLATLTQTFTSGVTVLYWIHGTVPTPALVADLLAKLFQMLAPAAAAPEAPARRPAGSRKPATKARAAKRPARTARRTTAKPAATKRASAQTRGGKTSGRRR